jgi:hypothetical protein
MTRRPSSLQRNGRNGDTLPGNPPATLQQDQAEHCTSCLFRFEEEAFVTPACFILKKEPLNHQKVNFRSKSLNHHCHICFAIYKLSFNGTRYMVESMLTALFTDGWGTFLQLVDTVLTPYPARDIHTATEPSRCGLPSGIEHMGWDHCRAHCL